MLLSLRTLNNKLAFTLSKHLELPVIRGTNTVWLLGLVGLMAGRAGAQAPRGPDRGIIVSGAWLQANALPLDRDAMQSGSVAVGLRRSGWAAEVGWTRIARTLSTVEGGSLAIQRPIHWRSVVLLPSLNFLGGKAYASVDSTGYDWTAAGGATGHTPRYSYSEGTTFGGGVGLTAELPIFSVLAVRAVASQWAFSGTSLEGDRARTVLGVGLSIMVGR